MSRMPRSFTQRGFTIVELLVVITIIGLLMALLIPAVAAARENARRAQCITNVFQLCKATQTYVAEKGFYPPYVAAPAAGSGTVRGWPFLLMPYLESADVNVDEEIQRDIFVCPSDPPVSNTASLSYGGNGGRVDTTGSNTVPKDWAENGVFQFGIATSGKRLERVSTSNLTKGDGASTTIAFAENVDLDKWTLKGVAASSEAEIETRMCNLWFNGAAPIALNKNKGTTSTTSNANYCRPSSMHANGFVVGFCSGGATFLSENIDYTVYCKLMTVSGKRIRDPGSSTYLTPQVTLDDKELNP